jgi:hypothetical protein
MKRVASAVVACLTLIPASGPIPSAQAVTLTGNESLNDGVLSATGGPIATNQTDGRTFWWADKNGDGTMVPASAGLNLATYNLTRSDGIELALGLNDGAADGALTWSGTSGGEIDTYRDGQPGSITITGAADIAVSALKTRGVNWGQHSGAIRVYQSGNFQAVRVYAHGLDGWMNGGAVVLHGGGPSAGALQVSDSVTSDGLLPGSVTIRGYRSVAIGAGGIDAHKNNGAQPATVAITNIGAGGLSIPLGTISTRDDTGQGSIRNNITIGVAGAVTVSSLVSRAGVPATGSWLYHSSGDVTVTATGNVQVTGLIDTRQVTTAIGNTVSAGDVNVTSLTGSVTLANIDTSSVRVSPASGYRAGHLTVQSCLDLKITGTSPNLSFGSTAYTNLYGALSLNTTGAGSRIEVQNLDCALFKTNNWTFNAGGGTSYIKGVITNLQSYVGGDGQLHSDRLRVPSGQIVLYDPKINPHLNGQRYLLGGGGILLAPPMGMLVVIR